MWWDVARRLYIEGVNVQSSVYWGFMISQEDFVGFNNYKYSNALEKDASSL